MDSEMHHIIHDPEQVKRFAKLFVPTVKHHAIVFQLFSRRKYYSKLPKSEYIISRIVAPGDSDPDTIYRSLLKTQVPVGAYTADEFIIPDGSTVLYCLIRPKDMIKAMTKSLTYCVAALSGDAGCPMRNPYGLYKKEIGTSGVACENKLTQIDIDTKDAKSITDIAELLQKAGVKPLVTIETRGGYHVIYNKTSSVDNRALYEYKMATAFEKAAVNGKMVKDYIFSITHEPNIAVPGTLQGGYPVCFRDDLFVS